MDAPLSQREFDTWRVADDSFKLEMRQFIVAQTQLNLTTEGRVAGLVQNQLLHDKQMMTWAGFIASIVAAIVGAVAGLLVGE